MPKEVEKREMKEGHGERERERAFVNKEGESEHNKAPKGLGEGNRDDKGRVYTYMFSFTAKIK